MKTKIALMAAALLATTLAAYAQNYGPPRDPNGYYSQSDQRGYYDSNGRYRQMRARYDRDDRRDRGPGYDQSANYYRQGQYEQSCRGGNAVAGTIFGAAAGGLVGSAVSRGNGGAVIGGAVLGGLLGNTIAKDIDCDDQPYAFNTYSEGLNGDVGRRYDWNHGQDAAISSRPATIGGPVCNAVTSPPPPIAATANSPAPVLPAAPRMATGALTD
jgi:hypothetical protein